MSGERGSYLSRGLKALVQYKKPGGAWRILPGLSSYRDPGRERESEEESSFAGPATSLGDLRIGEVTIDSKWMPHHQSWLDMGESVDDGSVLEFRATFLANKIGELTLEAGTPSLAIAATGVVTLAYAAGDDTLDFTKGQFDLGQVIEHPNGDFYVIDTIDRGAGDYGVPTVTLVGGGMPAAVPVVNAGDVVVWLPSLQRTAFAARVRKVDEVQAEGNTGVTTQLILVPLAPIRGAVVGKHVDRDAI